MKKRIAGVVLAVLLLLTGCGEKSEKTAYTAEDVAALMDAGVFQGDMEQVDSAVAATLFGLDEAEVVEITCYIAANSSVSADEVAVFVMTDEDAAQTVENACKTHLDSRKESSAQYCPDQVPKLEKAVIHRLGNTVLLAAGEPDALEQAVQELP